MTHDDDFIGQLEGYLDEYQGITPLPAAVRDAIRAELPTTKQLGPLGVPLGRFPTMNNNIVRFGIAAAAVVLVALLGMKFLPWSAMGGPTATPTATPERTPSPLLLGPGDLGRQLGARIYRVAGTLAVPFTITLPREWSLSTLDQGGVQFRAGYGLKFRNAYVVVDLIENVFLDPCHTEGGPMDPPVPSTVDGFVEALTRMSNFTAGPVSDVRIGEHGGKSFVLTNAIDAVAANCTGESLHPWTVPGGEVGRVISIGGETDQIWVIDVGGTIVVIDAESFPYTTDAVRGELEGIVESIRFEAEPSGPPPVGIVIEELGASGRLRPGQTYTSNLFDPQVTFMLAGLEGLAHTAGERTEACSPGSPEPLHTSARTIVLKHQPGCINDMRLIRPYAVDCGTADQHPDAETLAQAILAKLGTAGAHDGGTLENRGYVPSSLFAGSYQGRVLKIDPPELSRQFDEQATNPDHCRLLAEPGSSDPTIEVRGDMAALLLLIDINGELIVLRTSDGGYDAASGMDVRLRGGPSNPGLEGSVLDMLYNLRFD